MKGLRTADTQESCFEAWKRSHMGCFALLCGRFYDSQESRYQASKRSNIGSAVLEVGRSPDTHEFCFQGAKRSNMDSVEVQGVQFTNCQEWQFQVSRLSDNCYTILHEDDLLILKNRSFRLRNFEICAVLSRNEVLLLMLRKRFFWQRNDQK